MTDPKKLKLTSIKDEVGEFHPLLKALFRKLPGVIDVEYTHGPDEMGADFVFSRTHSILGNTEYTGVVAKIGKVVQDFTDIERQIDECITVSRKFLGGKEQIRINEIWVVITENITGGAKEKIYEKFKAQNIEFIYGDRLIKLIDAYFPAYWTETSLLIGEYLSNLRINNENMDTALSLWQYDDKAFYIEQDIYEYPRLEYRKRLIKKQKRPAKVNILEIIEKKDIILVEGGAGSGKSKLLRYLVNYYTLPDTYISVGILPIYTTYKEIVEQYGGDITALIDSRVKNDIRDELDGKKYLVLVDAFDEKKITVDEQVNNLAFLVENIEKAKDAKLILTSRYLSGLDRSNELENVITRLELAPLSMNRTIQFITRLCTQLNLTSRLIEDLKKSHIFRELPRSPISAILLAKLLNENPKDIPSNLPELYSQYIELVLGRWEIDKGLQSQKEYQALDNVLMKMAECMLDYEMPRMTLSDVKDLVRDYLEQRNLNLDIEQMFDRMTSRCDILFIDDVSRTLSFKHRSFAEYFYAKSLTKGKDPKLSERAFEFYWLNTVYFYLGILKDCPDLIELITMLNPETEGGKWLKIVNMANYLLAAYTTPYEKISIAITQTMDEASRLFNDIASGRILSPMSKMSHMTLLYLMQYLIRHSYSYNFFKEAFEETALRIDASDEEDIVKAYALFFSNVAYIELGGGESFDFLLKNHTDNLDIDLLLAINHESENFKIRTDLMKKQDRRIKKLLKGSAALNAQVKKLYDQPIESVLQIGEDKTSKSL